MQHSAFFAASKDGEDEYRSQPKRARPEVFAERKICFKRLLQKRHGDESFREALHLSLERRVRCQQIEFTGSSVIRLPINF